MHHLISCCPHSGHSYSCLHLTSITAMLSSLTSCHDKPVSPLRTTGPRCVSIMVWAQSCHLSVPTPGGKSRSPKKFRVTESCGTSCLTAVTSQKGILVGFPTWASWSRVFPALLPEHTKGHTKHQTDWSNSGTSRSDHDMIPLHGDCSVHCVNRDVIRLFHTEIPEPGLCLSLELL